MKAISASVARQCLPELLETVSHGRERVMIERHGRPIAILAALQEMETIEDLKGPEWNQLAQALPELNARLDRMVATLKMRQRRDQIYRKEMDRLHTQRKQLLWHS